MRDNTAHSAAPTICVAVLFPRWHLVIGTTVGAVGAVGAVGTYVHRYRTAAKYVRTAVWEGFPTFWGRFRSGDCLGVPVFRFPYYWSRFSGDEILSSTRGFFRCIPGLLLFPVNVCPSCKKPMVIYVYVIPGTYVMIL